MPAKGPFPMKFASVCSGIEAASVAWNPLGWDAAWVSEIEPFPCAVLAHHFPDTPNLGDMTQISDEELRRHGAVHTLVGGTPCQSFSVAGLRKGLDDPRGNLALVYLRLLDRLRPRWCLWENVPGVLSSNGGRDFGAFLGALAELGYGFCYRVLDARFWGVAQRRRRVFVVGHLGDWRPAAAVLFERESMRWDSPPSRKTREVASPGTRGGAPIPFDTTQMTSAVNRCQPRPGDPCHPLAAGAHPPTIAFSAKDHGADAAQDLTPTLRAMGHAGSHANGGQIAIAFHNRQDPDASGEITHPLGAKDNGLGVAVGHTVRRLTPRECERLQGFTDDWTRIPWRSKSAEECPDGPRYKALGNSMAVPVMRWIGERIQAVDQLSP